MPSAQSSAAARAGAGQRRKRTTLEQPHLPQRAPVRHVVVKLSLSNTSSHTLSDSQCLSPSPPSIVTALVNDSVIGIALVIAIVIVIPIFLAIVIVCLLV